MVSNDRRCVQQPQDDILPPEALEGERITYHQNITLFLHGLAFSDTQTVAEIAPQCNEAMLNGSQFALPIYRVILSQHREAWKHNATHVELATYTRAFTDQGLMENDAFRRYWEDVSTCQIRGTQMSKWQLIELARTLADSSARQWYFATYADVSRAFTSPLAELVLAHENHVRAGQAHVDALQRIGINIDGEQVAE